MACIVQTRRALHPNLRNVMAGSLSLNDLLAIPRGEIERMLRGGPLQVVLPADENVALLSSDGDGYHGVIRDGANRICHVTCAAVGDLVAFLHPRRV